MTVDDFGFVGCKRRHAGESDAKHRIDHGLSDGAGHDSGLNSGTAFLAAVTD
jgi:hypothetical protein